MIRVRDVMSKRLLVLRDNASIGRAQMEMKLAGIRHFPVLDKGGTLVGVVSSRDLVRAIGDGPVGKSIAVNAIMTTRMQTVRVDAPASDAARFMRSKKIGSVLVLDAEDQLVGIVTETDFLAIAERALQGRPLASRRARA